VYSVGTCANSACWVWGKLKLCVCVLVRFFEWCERFCFPFSPSLLELGSGDGADQSGYSGVPALEGSSTLLYILSWFLVLGVGPLIIFCLFVVFFILGIMSLCLSSTPESSVDSRKEELQSFFFFGFLLFLLAGMRVPLLRAHHF